MACEILKYIQVSSILGTSAAVMPHLARHYRTSVEMPEVSAEGKVGAQPASDALVQTFVLQRIPSVTMTSKTLTKGLGTVLNVSLCGDQNTVTSLLMIV